MAGSEAFQRRVRERMVKFDASDSTAGAIGSQQASDSAKHDWVSQPEQTDEVIRAKTGRDWQAWCEVIDSWPGHADGHAAVAAWLHDAYDVDGWWAQTITVGWERITGRRLPYQVADGTFTANKSATVTTDPNMLREMLLDDARCADLFPGRGSQLRSRLTSKNVRIGFDHGVAEFNLTPKDDGKVTVTITHAQLESPEDVERWKRYWSEWLEAIDG